MTPTYDNTPLAANSISSESANITSKRNNSTLKDESDGILSFTKKELSSMPKSFQKAFIYNDKIVKYRFYNGVYQARFRKCGYNIEVASKDFDTMKYKFISALCNTPEPIKVTTTVISKKGNPLFSEYARQWLKIKEKTTKPSTFKGYTYIYEKNLAPALANMRLSKIDRMTIQNLLFTYVEAKKFRTAENMLLELNCIFDMASDNFNIPSPMKNIVLPYHEPKKGSSLTVEEEQALINFCSAHPERDTSSGLLILFYFGLRKSEHSHKYKVLRRKSLGFCFDANFICFSPPDTIYLTEKVRK